MLATAVSSALGLFDADAKTWDEFVEEYQRGGEAGVRGSEKREHEWCLQMVRSDWLLARLQGRTVEGQFKEYPRQHLLSIKSKPQGKWLWMALEGLYAMGLHERMEALGVSSEHDAWRARVREKMGLEQLSLRGVERQAEFARKHTPPPHYDKDGKEAPPDSGEQVKRIVLAGKVAPNCTGTIDARFADTIGALDGDGLRYGGPCSYS
jgi:hypothetical protein